MQLELLLQCQELLDGQLLLPGIEKGQGTSGLLLGVEGERKLICPFVNHSTTQTQASETAMTHWDNIHPPLQQGHLPAGPGALRDDNHEAALQPTHQCPQKDFGFPGSAPRLHNDYFEGRHICSLAREAV